MSNDLVERARHAWLGARYHFEKVIDEEGSDEKYRRARDELERARQEYERLAGVRAR